MQCLRDARVDACTDLTAHITMLPPTSGGRCSGCGACGRSPHGETYSIPVPHALPPGTRIQVEFRTPNLAALSMLVFGMPLGLALVGGGLGAALSDTWMLLGGVGGMAAGFCLLWALNRHVPQLRARVTFVRVVDASVSATPACAEGHGKAGAGH